MTFAVDLSPAAHRDNGAPSLKVIEAFGPTVQGEGPTAGHPASFLRLASCNLDCQWCDTRYSWDWSAFDPRVEITRCDAERIAHLPLFAERTERLVITGGEPLMQARGITALLRELAREGKLRYVEIETNGTMMPLPPDPSHARLRLRYNVSPKLAHSGIAAARRVRAEPLRELGRRASVFKFVVRSADDADEIACYAELARARADAVWLMPEGETRESIDAHLPVAAEMAAERGWNVCDRLHVRAWGAERGR